MWIVVILINLVCRAYAVEAGEEEAIRLISINGELRLHDIEFLEMQSNILARRAQIEQTTGTLLELINRKQVSRAKIYSSGPISYGQRGASDWSYETYLVTSIKHILARERQFFDACHVQDQGRLPVVACSMPVHRKTLCAEKNSEDYLVSIYPRLHSDFIVVGNATDDFDAIKAILHSNCGEHESAQKLALQLTEKYPTNAYYKYILSEILARWPRDSLYFAINQIDAAIKLSPSVLAYREHRLMLLLRVQRSKATLDDASWIRQKAEHHLKDTYCSYCAKNRVRKPVGLVSWRPWFVLGLFDLISLNGTQAERDFTIALDLASEVGSGGGFPISDSVSHMLRHLKAIAQHHNNEFQDAMETAILNAHANPSALDAVLLISETLARASHYERSLSMLNLALPLMDAYSATPPGVAFIEIITDAPTIKHMSLQLRATVHYRLGDILEAESDAQACLELMPLDALCSYVKTLCMLVTGRFVDAVKSSAPVLSRWFDFKVRKSPEFIQLSYIKEWTRYLHQRVTRSMGKFHWLNDLSDLFKQSWIQTTPLESLVGYVDQPGIQAELPEYLTTPHQMMAILTGNSTDRRTRLYSFDQSTNGSFYNCPPKPFMWQHERRECQQMYLNHLAQILCKLETTYGLILNPGFITISPAMQPFNRRHRLSLVLGSLYSAELIRNYWCQRRRVAFGTCWSFNPDRDFGSQWRTTQFATYNDPLPEDGGDWGQSGYCSAHIPSASAHFHRGPCRSVRDEGPDWFVHTSFITQLLMLADPSETPPIWYANDRSLQTEGRSNYHSPHLFWTGAPENDRNAEHKPRPSVNPAEEESENEWTDASFRDQHYFIKHGMVQAESMTYTPAALQMMYSLMTLRAYVHLRWYFWCRMSSQPFFLERVLPV
ncbi:hypothetical protein CRM22_005269 [Opisthorchis felineus]|uniref:Uncharacterized protein n=1 Tax=Opisthorchis felineus TaxID=147828 RepID=A0A4S2LT99_OPIFE|nr:hypothetical protein CRM22_005269 [Opisthorchis felineus]